MTTKTTHTPGPWQFQIVAGVPTVHKALEPIATTFGNSVVREANAHLIAAAPDLLAALKDLLSLAEEYLRPPFPWSADAARAAIAKAEGR